MKNAPAPLPLASGLQRRLLVMLLVPLGILAMVSAWFDYNSAGNVALQQDQQLQRLAPLLADSVIAPGKTPGDPPLVLMAPAVEEFLKDRGGLTAFCLTDLAGKPLLGDAWMATSVPGTREPEFHSEEEGGVTYRIVAQRAQTSAGELVVHLADGSDARQQWVRSVVVKVLLPNLILIAAAAFAVNWAVKRALRPLLELKEAVERRSPRDLTAIDAEGSPDEVRPLVHSLNRLFGLVNAQAESQRRFVADAAHQLRTPLAGLQAQVEAWAQAAHRPPPAGHVSNQAVPHASQAQGAIVLRVDQIDKLRNATRRTSQLANQLLALSRADARSLDAQALQKVDLRDLCETLLEVHLDAATAHRIDLGLEAQAAHVMGHEWLLRELLGNLVDNAVKYTPDGGTVTIRCGWRDGQAFMEVEDNGPGVPEAERTRVLQRFYRVPGAVGEGNGLGLAIADEIARVHRSRLELGEGAAGGLRATLLFPEKP